MHLQSACYKMHAALPLAAVLPPCCEFVAAMTSLPYDCLRAGRHCPGTASRLPNWQHRQLSHYLLYVHYHDVFFFILLLSSLSPTHFAALLSVQSPVLVADDPCGLHLSSPWLPRCAVCCLSGHFHPNSRLHASPKPLSPLLHISSVNLLLHYHNP